MSFFDGLGEAPIFGRGNYLNPGSYEVQILRVFPLDTRASGVATIAELDVKASVFKPQDDPQGKGRIWQPSPPGAGSWYQDMSDRSIALPAIKEFQLACLGMGPGDPRMEQWLGYIPGSERWPTNRSGRPLSILTNLMDHVVSDANAFRDLFVHVDCTMIKTKKGGDFTRYDWKPLAFQALGIQPPNLEKFLALAMSPAPPVVLQQAGQPTGGFNAPPVFGQGYGQPPAQAAPPQGPPAWGQAPSPQGYGQPQFAQAAPPPVQGPPPGWGQPQSPPQTPAAQGWPASPQAAPPQGPPAWSPPPQARPPFQLPPGGRFSDDRTHYWVPGMANWAPVPQ